jgi:hypothetical protein
VQAGLVAILERLVVSEIAAIGPRIALVDFGTDDMDQLSTFAISLTQ